MQPSHEFCLSCGKCVSTYTTVSAKNDAAIISLDKDISIRLRNNENGNQTAVIFPHEFDLALEITSYIGVLLSLGGLSIFLLTHLIFK